MKTLNGQKWWCPNSALDLLPNYAFQNRLSKSFLYVFVVTNFTRQVIKAVVWFFVWRRVVARRRMRMERQQQVGDCWGNQENKIYFIVVVVVVVVVVFDNFTERQVGDCEENLEKWNVFGCCCHCGLLLKILCRAAAGGRLLRKLGKIRYIWDFVVLDYFCCNFRKLSFRRTFFCKCSFWTLVYNFSFQHLMYHIGGRLFKKLDEIVDFWLFSR